MTNNILNWAYRHGVSRRAIDELIDMVGIGHNPQPQGMSETAVSQRVRLAAAKKGIRLFRNNVGVWMDDRGVPVRYGLANESAEMNKRMKSSDLIGITPVVITPDMIGQTLGVFTAYEIKRADWQYSGKGREKAQCNFIMLVQSLGGIGKFITNDGDV